MLVELDEVELVEAVETVEQGQLGLILGSLRGPAQVRDVNRVNSSALEPRADSRRLLLALR